ncbi:inner membrane protein YbjM [Kosakonia oryzendophytica]|uniref:inner membrane protein YbjM n=1 Tax=Kosakonia TaxID=1330547 RepID=UPI0021DAA039|nr:inner membrane protein YbjM [Kosakonia sp. ML.JS2a]UXY09458.1 inner membrane protein YbjM [Kosakonia sp. ML.JS2a]
MKNKQRWKGIICCFVLFIAVCLYLVIKMKGALHTSAHPELGLLLFMLPGVVSCHVTHRRHVMWPLLGAVLAAPVCYLLTYLLLTPARPFWQVLAWLFSAVFWCGIGGLCCVFMRSLVRHYRQSRK